MSPLCGRIRSEASGCSSPLGSGCDRSSPRAPGAGTILSVIVLLAVTLAACGTNPTPTIGRLRPTQYINAGWSGYAIGNGPFTEVTGTFRLANIKSGIPNGDLMAEWVGIGGWPPGSTYSLIQAGVTETPDPSTPYGADLDAWWCTFPKVVAVPSLLMSSTDEITVTIWKIKSGDWGFSVTDDTNGRKFTTHQPYAGPQSSAEWIVEAPGIPTATLAPYGPAVRFSALGFGGAPEKNDARIVMVQDGTQVSTPSALDSNGFRVAYGDVAPAAP